MLNYKILPDFIYNFAVMPQSTYDALSHIKKHSWVILPTLDHITPEGIEYFKSKGIIFSSSVTCWKCNTDTIGPTHIDGPSLMGFNFVMKGTGRMEWMHSSIPLSLVKASWQQDRLYIHLHFQMKMHSLSRTHGIVQKVNVH